MNLKKTVATAFLLVGLVPPAHAETNNGNNRKFPINQQVLSCSGGYVSNRHAGDKGIPRLTGESLSGQLRTNFKSALLVNKYGGAWDGDAIGGDQYVQFKASVVIDKENVNKFASINAVIKDVETGKALAMASNVVIKASSYFQLTVRLSQQTMEKMNRDQYPFNGDADDMQNLSDLDFGWVQLTCRLEMRDGKVLELK